MTRGAWALLALATMSLHGAARATIAPDVFAHPATPKEVLALTASATGPLADARVVRGEFTQRRFLAELPKPIESSGAFIFARDRGILWRTYKPFASQVVLSEDGLMLQDEGAATVSVGAEPAMRFVAQVFFALFSLDIDALAADFALFGTHTDHGWSIGLEPRSAVLRAVFQRARIDGAGRAERVVLEDAYGDHTEILLQGVRYEAAPLPPAEAALF